MMIDVTAEDVAHRTAVMSAVRDVAHRRGTNDQSKGWWSELIAAIAREASASDWQREPLQVLESLCRDAEAVVAAAAEGMAAHDERIELLDRCVSIWWSRRLMTPRALRNVMTQ